MWGSLKQFLSNCKHSPTSHSWHVHGVLLLHRMQLCERSWVSLTGTGRWSHLSLSRPSRGTSVSGAASSSWKFCRVMSLSWWMAHSSLCKIKLLVTAISRKCWKMVTYDLFYGAPTLFWASCWRCQVPPCTYYTATAATTAPAPLRWCCVRCRWPICFFVDNWRSHTKKRSNMCYKLTIYVHKNTFLLWSNLLVRKFVKKIKINI